MSGGSAKSDSADATNLWQPEGSARQFAGSSCSTEMSNGMYQRAFYFKIMEAIMSVIETTRVTIIDDSASHEYTLRVHNKWGRTDV